MAKLEARETALNMLADVSGESEIVTNTDGLIRTSTTDPELGAFTVEFSGNFFFDSATGSFVGNLDTVTALGAINFVITDINRAVAEVLAPPAAETDRLAVDRRIFSGDDTIVGSSSSDIIRYYQGNDLIDGSGEGDTDIVYLGQPSTNFIKSAADPVTGNLQLSNIENGQTVVLSNVEVIHYNERIEGVTSEDAPLSIKLISNDRLLSIDRIDDSRLLSNPQNGVVSPSDAGELVYTPNPDFFGQDIFSVSIEGTAVPIEIDVTPVDDAPIANDDNLTLFEDQEEPLNFNVVENDSDADQDALTIVQVNGQNLSDGKIDLEIGGSGVITVSEDGVLNYRPATDFDGILQLEYTIAGSDPEKTDNAIVTINVNETNDPPIARDDIVFQSDDMAMPSNRISIPVSQLLENDEDPDIEGDLVISGVDVIDGGGGVPDLSGDNSEVVFTLNEDFDGSFARFSYEVSDGESASSANVTILVALDAPVIADADFFATSEGGALSVPVASGVLVNDDAGGQPVRVVAVNAEEDGVGDDITLASGARLSLNEDGSFDYEAAGAFEMLARNTTTQDVFLYTVADSAGNTNSAPVIIEISGSNDRPNAVDDGVPVTVSPGGPPVEIPLRLLLNNDSDIDNGDNLSISGATAISAGSTATLVGREFVRFSLSPTFDGSVASFGYTLTDGSLTDTAMVSVPVVEIDEPPPPPPPPSEEPPQPPPPPEEPDVSARLDEFVSIDLDEDDGEFAEGSGQILRNDLGSNLQVVEVNGSRAAVGNVTPLDSGASVRLSSDGAFEYIFDNETFDYLTRNSEFRDSFTYTIGNGTGATDSAAVIIEIAGRNDPPIASNDALASENGVPVTISPGESITVPKTAFLGNDRDIDGDELMIASFPDDLNVTATLEGQIVRITLDPSFNSLIASFPYTVTDGQDTDTATASLLVSDTDQPTLDLIAQLDGPLSNGLTENEATFSLGGRGVLENDFGEDREVISVNDSSAAVGSEIGLSSGASAILNSNGSLDYFLNDSFNYLSRNSVFRDTFTYTIGNGTGATDSSAVIIEIAGVNDRPLAVDDAIGLTVSPGGSVDIPLSLLLGNDRDIDEGDVLSVSEIGSSSTGTTADLIAGESIRLRLDEAFDGSIASFEYTVSDGILTDTATGSVVVSAPEGLAEAIIVRPDEYDDIVEREPFSVTQADGVLANDDIIPESGVDELFVVEVNGQPISQTAESQADGNEFSFFTTATLDMEEDGSFEFSPSTSRIGQDQAASFSFTYTVEGRSSNGVVIDTEIGTIKFIVNGENDDPFANDIFIIASSGSPVPVPRDHLLSAGGFDSDFNGEEAFDFDESFSSDSIDFQDDVLLFSPNLIGSSVTEYNYRLVDVHGASSNIAIIYLVQDLSRSQSEPPDVFEAFEIFS
jgi:hypothetical protein